MFVRELRFQATSQYLQSMKFKGPGFCLAEDWSQNRGPAAGDSKSLGNEQSLVAAFSSSLPPECLALCWSKASRCSMQRLWVRPDFMAGGGLQTFSGLPPVVKPGAPEETHFKVQP